MHLTLLFLLCSLVLCGCASGRFAGYKVLNITEESYGFQGFLQLISPGPYGSDINTVGLQVYFQSQQTLRIKLYDAMNARWEVPYIVQTPVPTTKPASMDYAITFEENPFGFAITRTSTGDVVFNTSSPLFSGLVFEDQYLEISTTLPETPNIYGLGERSYSFRLQTGQNYTMFNKDHKVPVQENLYGTHPFYLEMRDTGLAHGVFLLNSNAMDVLLEPGFLTYKTIGGILDFFIFLGPSPADVVTQYQTVIGFPYFPPYWAIGWHQCRWGYKNLSETMDVVENYAKYDLPLDTMWNDIDYMDSYLDYTTDPVNYPESEMRAFSQQLHANGQHYIIITDVGISVNKEYPVYQALMESGAYIKSYGTETPIMGQVWPGYTYFPDFFHPNATDWWADQIAQFYAVGPEFDGLWVDMNEPSNFCNAQCGNNTMRDEKLQQGYLSSWENPPYLPGGAFLDQFTLNVTAQQYISIMYNTHNLYGWSEGVATKIALERLRNKRAVAISRSTFAGSGHHHGHWLGDNRSEFADMYYSIPGILSMQLFGVALVGADICGEIGNTTPELCARWMQLGTLYPFSRNHNQIGQMPQEPYTLGPMVLNVSREALLRRYTLLPYYYTLFAGAHNNGTTIWRPLFFEFPTDTNTFNIDQQFMIGSSILVTPVLTENATTVVGYFPDAIWYDYYNGSALPGTFPQNISLDAPITTIPIHIRGGSIIPTQEPAMTTTANRLLPFTLLVALDANRCAQGQLYLDDGDSLNTIENGLYTYIRYTAATQNGATLLTNTVLIDEYEFPEGATLAGVTVYGVAHEPQKVSVDGSQGQFSYDSANQKLSIFGIKLVMTTEFEILWA